MSLKRIVSKQSPPTPDAGCHETDELPAVDLRHLLREKPGLDAERFGQLAAFVGVGLAARAARLDLLPQRRQKVRVVPRLLHEVADAAPHRLDREIDAAPAGHDDHREQAVELLDARQQVDPFTPRGRVAGVVQIHQHQIERARLERVHRRVGRCHRVVLDALTLEKELQRVEQIGLIVRDQDPRRHVAGNRHAGAPQVHNLCHLVL